MRLRCFVFAMLAAALAGCETKDLPSAPSGTTTTSGNTPTPQPTLPQEMRIQVSRVADQVVGVRVWGAVRRGVDINADERVVAILLYDRTCADRRKYQNNIGAPNNPIDGTDSSYFPQVRVCGNEAKFAIGIQTSTSAQTGRPREIMHTLDPVRIDPNTYRRVQEGSEWLVRGAIR